MRIRIANPAGVAPRISPRELPENFAQSAVNCRMDGGDLRPWADVSAAVATVANTNGLTIYRFGQDVSGDTQYWFSFAGRVSLARVPVAGDTAEKTIFADGTYPKITDSSLAVGGTPYPNDSYRLGIVSPDAAISTATVGGTATPNTSAEDRYYIYTWLTSWGEESLPSPAKGPVSVKPGETVDLSGIPTTPSGGFVDRGNVTHKRIYRSNTGSTSTEYQFVAEIAIGTTTLHDDIDDGDLGEICPSLEWAEPSNALHSLVALTNGMVAGLDGNEACICEPFRPWAWPEAYRTPIDGKLIGAGGFGGYLVICTDSDPFIGYATTPEAYTFERIRIAQGCVSQPSIVSTGDGVIYASPDGLVAVSQGAAPVITDGIFSRDEWQKLNPSSIVGAFTEGRYHGWYSGASAPYNAWDGFILDLKSKTFSFTDVAASAVYVDPIRDALYVLQSTSVCRWGGGSAMSATWKSKLFEFPKPVNLGAAQIIVTSGTVSINIYATMPSISEASAVVIALGQAGVTNPDGTAIVKTAISSITTAEPFRLPSGFMARSWEIEITGTGQWSAVIVAQTMAELKGE